MTALRIVIVCILNISFTAATAFAQIPWNMYTPEMGFPSSRITCVGFSPSGILWLGTDNGLYRYDGSRTDIFTTNDGLPSNSISSIAFTRNGGIWVGTSEYQPYTGITRFNGSAWEPLVDTENNIAESASKVTTDFLGNLWAIREGSWCNPHVWTYNGKQWKDFGVQDGLSHPIIYEISVAPDGSVWCLDDNGGVYRYDGKQWISIPAPSNYNFSGIGKITFGQENDVWLFGDYWESSWDTQPAIWVSQGATGIWQKYADTIPVKIYSMAVDRSGALWCLYYSPNGNELYRTRDHQKTYILNDIDCFALGKDGTVWAAGGRRGIGRFNGTEWKWYTRSDGLLSNDFSCITVGPDGKVWAAVKPFLWNGYVEVVGYAVSTGRNGKRIPIHGN